MHSIRFKITAITIIAIIITELCVAAVTFYTIQSMHTSEAIKMMDLRAQDTKKSLEKYTESIEQSVDMAAHIAGDSMDKILLVETGAIRKPGGHRTKKQQSMLDDYLADYCNKIKGSFASVASHTPGVVSYYFCLSPDISLDEHGFFCSKIGKTGFYERDPLDASKFKDDGEQALWYFVPIKHGHPDWVGPYDSKELDGVSICSYVVPIYNSGVLIGVLGMDILTDTLISQVKSIKVYRTGYACLFSEDNLIIYHPQLEMGSDEDPAGLFKHGDVVRKGSSDGKLIRYEYQGRERQLSYCSLSNGMRVIVSVPVSEINAAWAKTLTNDILATILIVAIVAIVVMLIMRTITKPLLSLTEASRKLADGDYDVELNYKGKDEVGTLTSAFSRMRGSIREYIGDLNKKVYTDDMTGLPNMRYFLDQAGENKKEILREGETPVMLYFNLIGMKHFNRQYGYEEGNRLICAFAEILRKHYDTQCICRLNQDRFAAVSIESGLEFELREIIKETSQANGGRTLPLHIGIYSRAIRPIEVHTAIDRAKYICDKHRGSYISGYYFFTIDDERELEDNRYILTHLDEALKSGWIKVFYQPIIFAASGEKCDEEALSRWDDPERGLISPDDFIPYLEKASIIYKLDLYVLDRVLEKLNALKAAGEKAVPISVNLSRTDFDACDMVEVIRRKVDEAGVDRDMITIEITESTVGSNFEFIRDQVRRFQKLGFPVWMDDFGSGYSSLDVLQDIHFDLIKLDMRFMRRFKADESSPIIVRELLTMVNSLHVDTICEGVETGEQVSFLRKTGCTKLQGYYYGKPAPWTPK